MVALRSLAMDTARVLKDLESSGYHDLAGTRASARIPVSRALVNRVVADALRGSSAPIRHIDVQPRSGDRFDITIAVTWPFVPPDRKSTRLNSSH